MDKRSALEAGAEREDASDGEACPEKIVNGEFLRRKALILLREKNITYLYFIWKRKKKYWQR